ncbi:hypothetical protein MACJ_003712 [Theileria orientalis]|uniref:Uncharacterized protein n=1 Tax=Theileria orientalis TaxID=68886 RepID=A0A976XKP9_THEOR|nr:hypothetical protein MACJ_003712 [Theileria orientalis]
MYYIFARAPLDTELA